MTEPRMSDRDFELFHAEHFPDLKAINQFHYKEAKRAREAEKELQEEAIDWIELDWYYQDKVEKLENANVELGRKLSFFDEYFSDEIHEVAGRFTTLEKENAELKGAMTAKGRIIAELVEQRNKHRHGG